MNDEAKSNMGVTKLAVLGGGPSALTALYTITSDPVTAAKYDITVYQMGWRLGGKGASGREQDGRILEHGLHVLFGFYENFFSMIRACYTELNRPENHPLSTWDKAFLPHNFGVVEEFFQDRWQPWCVEFPENNSTPGDGKTFDTTQDYISMMGQMLLEMIEGWRALHKRHEHRGDKPRPDNNPYGADKHTPQVTDPLVNLLMRLLEWPVKHALKHRDKHQRHAALRKHTGWFQKWLWSIILKWSQKSLASHRFWLGCDYALAMIKGMVDDDVLSTGGFNRVDKYDFRQWLALHGAHPATLASPYGRTVYDAAFSYQDGNPEKQLVAAGVAIRCALRMSFTYKGSNYYKMAAGMGDTVFTPIYEVLKKRGVKFEFFHKVDALHLSPENENGSERSIASISITRQASLKSPDEEYQPLINVLDLDCWPSHPLYEQLNDADTLKNHNLESYYDHLPDTVSHAVTLREGVDYDKVLYAIPIGAVSYVCEELVKDNSRWETMVEKIQSVSTVTMQLWFKKNLRDLGWTDPSPLLSLYVQPLNTWADMSQVIPRESWPAGEGPKNISYYCGAQKGPRLAPDPRDPANATFEREQFADAKAIGLAYCRSHIGTLMPLAVDSAQPPQLDWNVLVDLNEQEGEERFNSQYWRSNAGPSERCTIALPGATEHRIKAGETGYSNLCITGDWIDNGFYVACMEGTIMAGIHGARAITGIDYPIVGELVDDM